MEPLKRLTRKDVTFKWSEEQQKAFDLLKKELVNMALVAHPRFGELYIIDCDSSTAGLGAVLSQKDRRGIERPVAFASKALKKHERIWPTTELEAYSVVWALEPFRPWIEGSPILVRTDHCPLLWVRNNVGKTDRRACWVV